MTHNLKRSTHSAGRMNEYHVNVKAVNSEDATVVIYRLTFSAPTQDVANKMATDLAYLRAGTACVSLYYSWEHMKVKPNWDKFVVKVPEEIVARLQLDMESKPYSVDELFTN
jgi:hypothetical protein